MDEVNLSCCLRCRALRSVLCPGDCLRVSGAWLGLHSCPRLQMELMGLALVKEEGRHQRAWHCGKMVSRTLRRKLSYPEIIPAFEVCFKYRGYPQRWQEGRMVWPNTVVNMLLVNDHRLLANKWTKNQSPFNSYLWIHVPSTERLTALRDPSEDVLWPCFCWDLSMVS